MRNSPLCLTPLLLALSFSCSTPRNRPISAANDPASTATVEMTLAPPINAQTDASLQKIDRLARQGDCRAAWVRGRVLLDLFDIVRLAPTQKNRALPRDSVNKAHALLWHDLDLPGQPSRGPLATKQVMNGIAGVFGQIPARCSPERHQAQKAQQLLMTDRLPRTDPEHATRVAVAYKRIARSASPLAPNATLRLLDWCSKAFVLAAGGDPARQRQRINQCLYPLFDADPAPYFESDPGLRPPDPPWPLLVRELSRQLQRLGKTRLGFLARALLTMHEDFFRVAGASLPTPLDLSHLIIPHSTHGDSWDRTPLIIITKRGYLLGGRAIFAEDPDELEATIIQRLHNDRRGRVAVVGHQATALTRVLEVARLARRAGASILEVGVARQVAQQAPVGDVQRMIFSDKPVLRLEVLPFSIELYSSPNASSVPRRQPLGLSYDGRAAEHQLRLLLSKDQVRAGSIDGLLPVTTIADLGQSLEALRLIYPEETSLVVVPEPASSYGVLVAASSKVRQASCRPSFSGLALGTSTLLSPAGNKDLQELASLLSRAVVQARPLLDPALLHSLELCYKRTVRTLWRGDQQVQLPQGRLVVRPTPRGPLITAGTMKERSVRECTVQVLSTQSTLPSSSVVVTFQLQP